MSKQENEGEGSRTAARAYNKDVKETVDSGKVEEKAREAKPESEQEKKELREAERAGKARAKEEDPAVKRD